MHRPVRRARTQLVILAACCVVTFHQPGGTLSAQETESRILPDSLRHAIACLVFRTTDLRQRVVDSIPPLLVVEGKTAGFLLAPEAECPPADSARLWLPSMRIEYLIPDAAVRMYGADAAGGVVRVRRPLPDSMPRS